MSWKEIEGLPPEVAQTVDRFCEDVARGCEGSLRSIVLYGDLARGVWFPNTPQVHLLVVVSPAMLNVLNPLVEPVARARKNIDLRVLVLEPDDLETSTDVFPIQFLDMQEHYAVLVGDDCLEPLMIGRSHLRLRCEQAIKQLLWLQRSDYLRLSADAAALSQSLSSAVREFLTTLRGVLLLRRSSMPLTSEDVIETAGSWFSLDLPVLRRLLAQATGSASIHGDELHDLYQEFLVLLADLGEQLDKDL